MAATQTTVAIRSYRIYFRDARNSIAAGHEVDLPSDDEARALAALMLDERNAPSQFARPAPRGTRAQ